VNVVRFVDDDQLRPVARPFERLAVIGCELRRREDDVPTTVFEGGFEHGALAAVDRAVRAQDAQTERFEPLGERIILIVGKRAQRVEDERLLTAVARAFRSGQLKA